MHTAVRSFVGRKTTRRRRKNTDLTKTMRLNVYILFVENLSLFASIHSLSDFFTTPADEVFKLTREGDGALPTRVARGKGVSGQEEQTK